MLLILTLFAALVASNPLDDRVLDLVKLARKAHRFAPQNNCTANTDGNPCDVTECDTAEIFKLDFPFGVCVSFAARLAASDVTSQVEAGIDNLDGPQLTMLYDLICSEAECMLAFFDVMDTVRGRQACVDAPQETKDAAIDLPSTFSLICSQNSPASPCIPYLADALEEDTTNQCLALYDISTATNEEKDEIACCLMNDMQCCYPTLADSYGLASRFPDLDFTRATSTCSAVSAYQACGNPFEAIEYASQTLTLKAFNVDDLSPLIQDLADIYGVDLAALSAAIGNTTEVTRRRRFQTLVTSTDVIVEVRLSNDTDKSDLVATMNQDLAYADLTAVSANNPGIGAGDTGVVKTKAAILAPPEPYVARTYTPTEAVEQFHSWPRLAGSAELNFQEMEDYTIGLGSVIGPFLAIGILTFLCLPVVHCIRNRKCDETCTGKGSKFFYLFMLLLVFIGCFLGFLSSAETGNAITGFVDGIGDLGNIFTMSIQNTKDADTEVATANAAYDTLAVTCSGNANIQAMCADGAQLNTDTNQLLTDFADEASPLEENFVDLEEQLAGSNGSRESMTYAALAFALITFVIGGIHELQMMKDGTGFSCTYYVVLFLGMIVMLGAWSTGGVNALLGVLVSDVCMDPVGILVTNLDDPAAQNELKNLFSCDLESEMFSYLDAAVENIPLIQLKITQIENEQAANGGCGAGFAADLANLKSAEQAFVDEAVATFKVFECPNISNILQSIIYDALCTDLTAGAQLYLGASCMVGIFGLFALCVFRKETVEK